MSEFRGVEAEFFAFRRLNYIESEVDRLQPEIELLNPQEGSKRLEPLEAQVNEQHKVAKSLNVEYKMNVMKEIKEDAKDLEDRGRKSVLDMAKVGDDISGIVYDMREIADGLGSGVTPDQLNTSIELGNRWLDEIRRYDFSEERARAVAQRTASSEMVESVNEFSAPAESFKSNVSSVDGDIAGLRGKLDDLTEFSMKTSEMLREANAMNFRNSDPPAAYKTNRISDLMEASRLNIETGSDLVSEADDLVQTASDNYDRLRDLQDIMDDHSNDFGTTIRADAEEIVKNKDLLSRANNHATDLEYQARQFENILAKSKSPGSRTLEAASAYEKIVAAVGEARESAERGLEAANNAQSMSFGVRDKATSSRDRTQVLYDQAQTANQQVVGELEPQLRMAKINVDEVGRKTKITKEQVELITKSVDGLTEVTGVLKETVDQANDAETIAHDALASIDARADEITRNMGRAKDLQDDYEELKFSVDATKKALDDIDASREVAVAASGGDAGRVRRQEGGQTTAVAKQDLSERLKRLAEREQRIKEIREKVEAMMDNVKDRLVIARSNISTMNVGVGFNAASTLELRTPENLEQLAVSTEVTLFVNVTRKSGGGTSADRAFILYVGNEEETHTKMPKTDTDDYLALEVIKDGRVKLTMDLGAGKTEVYSTRPLVYGQWNKIEIERQGHTVTLAVSMEESPGEVSTDTVVDYLPRYDSVGRPFGSVFNLHPDYSRIFVGGFPATARIQGTVKANNMEGQVEGLTIGGEAVGLFNFKASSSISGAPGRDKFKTEAGAERGVRFGGNGFLSLDTYSYQDMEEELSVSLRFKPEDPNGALLVAGDESEGDFVALEIRNKYIVYSFNLGDGTAVLTSDVPVDLNIWHSVEISRQGRRGQMKVDNAATTGEAEAPGEMERLSITSDIYLGGFPGAPLPFPDVSDAANFTGCVEDFYLGMDKPELKATSGTNAKEGCQLESEPLAHFPVGIPGFVQLRRLSLQGTLEMSFMFRTGQRKGMLMYAIDTSGFYYVSMALLDGALDLKVFPDYEINTAGESSSTSSSSTTSSAPATSGNNYNDQEWHTVSLTVTTSEIQLHVDDHDYFRLEVQDPGKLPQLDLDYNMYLGGMSPDMTLGFNSVASDSPYIGCIRDVLVLDDLVDFARVDRAAGIVPGRCVMELPTQEEGGDGQASGEVGGSGTTPGQPSAGDDDEDEEDEEGNGWGDLTPTVVAPPEIYGQCNLPLSPAPDPDINKMSGLRFGTKRDTYLKFHKKLKVRKRSEFSIELKTTVGDGIVFYVADETHTDFIALLIKEGKLVYGFNCGSGSVYIETEDTFDDGQWHLVEFSRQGERGKLFVDRSLRGEQSSYGSTKSIEVAPEFYLGGVGEEAAEDPGAQRNLMKVESGFVGCLRNFKLKGKSVGKWSRNNKSGVIPCSDKVEPGFFIGPDGGSILAAKKFRVGLDFDVTMQIKPRNVSGILLAIQGRRDYLILQMVDGTMTFTVDNGRGPITAIFKPRDSFQFCDGQWHDIHAVKAKNVVTLSVDGTFAQPGIGVPGVSSTDTNHGLFLGGHQKASRLTGRNTDASFVGCIKDIVIEGAPLEVRQSMLRGDVTSHVCPTI